MADWLILKKDPNSEGAEAWQVVSLAREKTADAAGATEALVESYRGPGRYGIVRADNARTVDVEPNPKIKEHPTPSW